MADEDRIRQFMQHDGHLLQRFLDAGDETAFAELMSRHGQMVYNVALRMLGQSQDAEDALQAVFLVLAKKASHLRRRANLAGWLYEAAYNVALHSARARRVREKHEREAAQMKSLMEQSSSPEGLEEDEAQLKSRLDAEIQSLPAKFRLPVILHHFEGYSHEEGAAVLGVSVGTFSSRLSRGRDRLRKRLNQAMPRQTPAASDSSSSSVLLMAGVSLPTVVDCLTKSAASVPAGLVTSTAHAAALAVSGHAAAAGVVSAKVAALSQGTLNVLFKARLKLAGLAALFTMVAIGSAFAVQAVVLANHRDVSVETSPTVQSTPASASGVETAGSDGRISVQVKIPSDQNGRDNEIPRQ